MGSALFISNEPSSDPPAFPGLQCFPCHYADNSMWQSLALELAERQPECRRSATRGPLRERGEREVRAPVKERRRGEALRRVKEQVCALQGREDLLL